jgi:hypothetical protein
MVTMSHGLKHSVNKLSAQVANMLTSALCTRGFSCCVEECYQMHQGQCSTTGRSLPMCSALLPEHVATWFVGTGVNRKSNPIW